MFGLGRGLYGVGVLLNLPSPLMTFYKYNVIDIHHLLTFQTLGDTWPVAFYQALRAVGQHLITHSLEPVKFNTC